MRAPALPRFFCFMVMMSLCTNLFAAAKDGKTSLESKIALESSMENRLKQVLTDITGTEKIIVIVNVQLADEKVEQKQEKKEDDFILPGVPIKEAISEKQVGDAVMAALGEDSRTLIRKLSATIILDKGVSPSVVAIVKEVATGLLGVDAARGDQLVVRQMLFQKNPFYWGSLIYPPHVYWVVSILASLVFALALLLFLFGPFRGFAREFVAGIVATASALKDNNKTAEESSFAGGAAALPELAAGKAETKPAVPGGKEPPFAFVNESNINALIFLLKDEEPKFITIVINYLPAPLAAKVLASIDADKQKAVAVHMAQVRELDAEQVDELEVHIENRIGYLAGGKEKLAGLLDNADETTRDQMLATLQSVNAALADELKHALITVDVLAQLDVAALQAVIRAVSPAVFGQLVRSLTADLQDKIFATLPTGAATRIRQEIDLAQAFSPQRLEVEKRRVVDVVRRLEARGMIQR